jgi:hypothetical protein
MAEVKYTISRTDIENTPKMFIYSKLDLYHTVRIDEEGKETFNGDVNEYMVRNGIDGIPSFEVDKWRDAVESFIYDHNDKVYAGDGFNVKFNITSVDSRGAYAYEETVNGEIVKSGVGWGLDFDTQVETDAWMDAVIKYNKANGIKMPIDKIREKLDKLKESIKLLDNELPEDQGFEMPIISLALPSLNSDPCEFVSKVKEASENVVATIVGMPAPKDIINHNIKIVKENIYAATTRTYDAQTKIIETPVNNFEKEFIDDTDYWREINAYYSQLAREEGESVALFDVVIEPPIKYEPINLIYDGAESADNDGDIYLPTGSVPIVEISESDKAIEYKEVTFLNIYNPHSSYGTAQENYIAKNHVGEAMRNLWVPLRKGWEEYAKNTLHIDPTWHISSGYRPKNYNKKLKRSSSTSAHMYGYAIDVQLLRFLGGGEQKRTAARYLSGFIKAFLKQNKHIQFDQILIEFDGGNSLSTSSTSWVHIGYKNQYESTRRQFSQAFNANVKHGNQFETL